MSSTPAKRASEAAAKLQAFLQSADLAAIVTKPKQVAVADAAIATSLIFDVLARIVPVQGFDAAARIQFDTLHVVGGAVLWGRVASLATRVATLKHAEADTDKHAVVDAATWPTLFDDDVYFGALAIDMTRKTSIVWDAAAEATHFARGVRAFFSGALTSGDVFVADLTRVRRGFLPQAEGGEAAFAAVAARFAFELRRCESQPQPPAIMKIELDKSQEDAATAVVREHLHAHLFAASAWLDAAGIERRNPPRPPKRPRGDEMAAVDVDDVARAATQSLAPNSAVLYDSAKSGTVRKVNMFKNTELTSTVIEKFYKDKRLLSEALAAASAAAAPPATGQPIADIGNTPPRTVAVYVVPSLSPPPTAPDEGFSLMRRVFLEARRISTLTYLLEDKSRLIGTDSFLDVMNSGQENVTMMFRQERRGYAPESHPNAEGVKLSSDEITEFTRYFDVLRDQEASETKRVDTTILRLPKRWDIGFETPEDASRVLAQYMHASQHDVGAALSGAYCFKNADLVDHLEFLRWNFLYAPVKDVREWSTEARQLFGQFQNYVRQLPEGAPGRQEWMLELTRPDEDFYPSGPPVDPVDPAYAAIFQALLENEAWRDVVQNSPVLSSPREKKVYETVSFYRLLRRDTIEMQFAENIQLKQLDVAWYLNACGVTPEGKMLRKAKCGAAASRILKPKNRPKIKSDASNVWGLMLVVERMQIEFGSNEYAPEGSVLSKTIANAKKTDGLDGIKIARQQFKEVETELDEVWRLLARMSSVGILNCDSHLGNYMLSSYGDGVKAKIIDFDPRWTFLLSADDMKQDWKPLYVLNTLLVLFTLSGDKSRIRLYDILKNAQRPGHQNIFSPNQVHSVASLRISQFQDVVIDVAAEIARANDFSELSLIQKLLSMSWGGGFKGSGSFSDRLVANTLALPTAFLVAENVDMLLKRGTFESTVAGPDYRASSSAEVKQASKVFNAIATDPRISNSPPAPDVAFEKQIEWALRLNLAWRGVVEQLRLVHGQWTQRQRLVYIALKRRELQRQGAVPFTGLRLSSEALHQLVQLMTPQELRNFNMHHTFFKDAQQLISAPLLYHLQRPRDANFNLLSMLSEYVFAPSLSREVGYGKLVHATAPRYPPREAEDEPDLEQWPRWMTDDDREILALPPVVPIVPSAPSAPVAPTAEPSAPMEL